MADETLTFKHGDTWPPRTLTLTRNGAAFDTTGAISGLFRMKAPTDTLVERDISFVTPRSGGQVQVHFADTDVDFVGDFKVNVKLQYPGGILTIPSTGFADVVIEQDLEDLA